MNDKIEKFLDAEADYQAAIDELLERDEMDLEERIGELLEDAEERDAELFEYFAVDPNETLGDYVLVPVFERGPLWVAGFSALFGACETQAYMEIMLVDVLKKADKHYDRIEAARSQLTSGELRKAAIQGIGKARITNAKEARATRKS